MKIGLIGLGKMGGNLALNIIDHGHDVVVYNRSAEKMVPYVEKGAIAGASLEELVGSLEAPRMIWVMVTAGDAVDHVIAELTPL
ncbi:MAG: NAD(P)-binding domain-containing protein, partial [Waddliaceae bacterium]|nr:NAD(P)-binding domain-containing protein [Waddliaceae bacterium]